MNPVKIMMNLLVIALVWAVLYAFITSFHQSIVFLTLVAVGFIFLMRARKRVIRKRR